MTYTIEFWIGIISSMIGSFILVPETFKACKYQKVKMNKEYLYIRIVCCILNII